MAVEPEESVYSTARKRRTPYRMRPRAQRKKAKPQAGMDRLAAETEGLSSNCFIPDHNCRATNLLNRLFRALGKLVGMHRDRGGNLAVVEHLD
jgi:hypothetical protein